jgi:hypothetical protein
MRADAVLCGRLLRRCWVSIAVTAALQVMLTYIPGLNGFFGMPQGMYGIQWVRVLICMVIVYVVVEIEKALVDPVLMPVVGPVLDFIEEHSPKCLRLPRLDAMVPQAVKKLATISRIKTSGKVTADVPAKE